MKEEWKTVKGYEGLYEISSYGRVKSLAKRWTTGNGGRGKKEETILYQGLNRRGYFLVSLVQDSIHKSVSVHTLVWEHFGNKPRNGRKLQVDHIDENKTNNRIDNLQLLTNRENMEKSHKRKKHSSKYLGVSWYKQSKKWRARICINGKRHHLGHFTSEKDAHLSYQKALKELI